MSTTYLSLGTNIENRFENIEQCKLFLSKKVGKIIKQSGLYETAPWGMDSKNPFINQVIIIETTLTPDELINKTQEIETQMGRLRHNDKIYHDRNIDIDILFYDQIIYEVDNLTIPHPKIAIRKFVLEPLIEIAPLFEHPILKRSIASILEECEDLMIVKKIR